MELLFFLVAIAVFFAQAVVIFAVPGTIAFVLVKTSKTLFVEILEACGIKNLSRVSSDAKFDIPYYGGIFLVICLIDKSNNFLLSGFTSYAKKIINFPLNNIAEKFGIHVKDAVSMTGIFHDIAITIILFAYIISFALCLRSVFIAIGQDVLKSWQEARNPVPKQEEFTMTKTHMLMCIKLIISSMVLFYTPTLGEFILGPKLYNSKVIDLYMFIKEYCSFVSKIGITLGIICLLLTLVSAAPKLIQHFKVKN